ASAFGHPHTEIQRLSGTDPGLGGLGTRHPRFSAGQLHRTVEEPGAHPLSGRGHAHLHPGHSPAHYRFRRRRSRQDRDAFHRPATPWPGPGQTAVALCHGAHERRSAGCQRTEPASLGFLPQARLRSGRPFGKGRHEPAVPVAAHALQTARPEGPTRL
ncbi:Acetyltransferase, partial [Pseudomonas sp. FG-3G]